MAKSAAQILTQLSSAQLSKDLSGVLAIRHKWQVQGFQEDSFGLVTHSSNMALTITTQIHCHTRHWMITEKWNETTNQRSYQVKSNLQPRNQRTTCLPHNNYITAIL